MLFGMDPTPGLNWSVEVDQGEWIRERLRGWAATVISIVPEGFEAYARVLHPAETPGNGPSRLIRWREVADWAGVPLRPDAQFHSVALPPNTPPTESPIFGQGPAEGNLYGPDLRVVAEIAGSWTSTPDQCWFCIWDGYGWDNQVPLTPHSQGVISRLPDPIPPSVRAGPRVRLPGRDYFLFGGSVEAAADCLTITLPEQSPNLWWPQDHAWCVATEIDLPWTYVGGPSGMIDQLLRDDRIEVLPAFPEDVLNRIEDWVQQWIDQGVNELLEMGKTTISTAGGTVEASLERRGKIRQGVMRYSSRSISERFLSSGYMPIGRLTDQAIRDLISSQLASQVTRLTG
jgi:hypothetical protein